MARPKKTRLIDFHFYEWNVARWLASETRDKLNATGRGIYRELLDTCYISGSFPNDDEWICRKCACTPEELAYVWGKIKAQFVLYGTDKNRYENRFAALIRVNYTGFVLKQSENGKKRYDNPPEINSMVHVGTAIVPTMVQPTKDTKETKVRIWTPSDGWDTITGLWKGDELTDGDCRIYISVIFSEDEFKLLVDGLKAWESSQRWKDGYRTNFQKFLREGQYKTKPKGPPTTEQRPGYADNGLKYFTPEDFKDA